MSKIAVILKDQSHARAGGPCHVGGFKRRNQGYLIIEVLIVLMLLGVFALVATRLFYASMKVITASSSGTDPAMRFDTAIAALRQDLSTADSSEMPDAKTLVIHAPGNQIVRWQADGTHELSRESMGQQRRWDVAAPVEFHRDGSIVLVRPIDNPTAEIAMIGRRDVSGDTVK
jgi:type II secretory pathway pseudopilin PulG